MTKWLLAGVTAAIVVSAASVASAATSISMNAPAADGSISGTFKQDGTSGVGTFTDTFNFTLPLPGDTVGSVTTSATKVNGVIKAATNIDFLSATLDGQAFSLSPTGQFEFGNIDINTVAGLQTLVVKYKSWGKGATYSGTLAFTPSVPEPASWAMMIAGFGMLGATLRVRRGASELA